MGVGSDKIRQEKRGFAARPHETPKAGGAAATANRRKQRYLRARTG
jgi:hypothetical protein